MSWSRMKVEGKVYMVVDWISSLIACLHDFRSKETKEEDCFFWWWALMSLVWSMIQMTRRSLSITTKLACGFSKAIVTSFIPWKLSGSSWNSLAVNAEKRDNLHWSVLPNNLQKYMPDTRWFYQRVVDDLSTKCLFSIPHATKPATNAHLVTAFQFPKQFLVSDMTEYDWLDI